MSWHNSLEPMNVTLFGSKGLCIYNEVKDLERRSSWIIWVSPKSSSKRLYKSKAEGDWDMYSLECSCAFSPSSLLQQPGNLMQANCSGVDSCILYFVFSWKRDLWFKTTSSGYFNSYLKITEVQFHDTCKKILQWSNVGPGLWSQLAWICILAQHYVTLDRLLISKSHFLRVSNEDKNKDLWSVTMKIKEGNQCKLPSTVSSVWYSTLWMLATIIT